MARYAVIWQFEGNVFESFLGTLEQCDEKAAALRADGAENIQILEV